MICKFIRTIEKYKMLENGDTVIVALSGGADSMTLLHLLKTIEEKFSLDLIAAHVNHMIRGEEANRDMDFVTDVCKKMGVQVRTLVFDVPGQAKISHESLEECGRRIRYDFFKSISPNAKIATAHNLCDNEETVLMNIARGSGLNGLKGISPVRGNIIRPLLFVTRQEIEDYCLANGIIYVHDSTNDVDDYKRNYVRHNVIPSIRKMNESFDKTFANCISLIEDDCNYFEIQTDRLLKKAEIGENKYDVSVLNNSHRAVTSRALAKIISSLACISPEKKHIDLLMQTMLLKYGKVQITGGITAFVRKGVLYFENEIPKMQEVCFEVNFDNEYLFLDRKISFSQEIKKVYNQFSIDGIDCDKLCGKVYLRNRRSGDEIYLQKRKVKKSLKKLFSQENIVQSQRWKIPVIADENGVVWVFGFGCDERCKVDETTKKIIYVNCKSGGEK